MLRRHRSNLIAEDTEEAIMHIQKEVNGELSGKLNDDSNAKHKTNIDGVKLNIAQTVINITKRVSTRFILIALFVIAVSRNFVTLWRLTKYHDEDQEQAFILPHNQHQHEHAASDSPAKRPAAAFEVLPNCPEPRRGGVDWKYYTSLPQISSEMASGVRKATADPIYHKDRGHDKIPHRLVFTHYKNLLDCSLWESNETSPQLYNLAMNVRATLDAYRNIWPDLEYVFLTDDDCINAIEEVEPGLVGWFNALDGMLHSFCYQFI
jgi:hypothetical protein